MVVLQVGELLLNLSRYNHIYTHCISHDITITLWLIAVNIIHHFPISDLQDSCEQLQAAVDARPFDTWTTWCSESRDVFPNGGLVFGFGFIGDHRELVRWGKTTNLQCFVFFLLCNFLRVF